MPSGVAHERIGADFLADAAFYKLGSTVRTCRAWCFGKEQFFKMKGNVAVRCTTEVFEAYRKLMAKRENPGKSDLIYMDAEFHSVLRGYETQASSPKGAVVVDYDPAQPEPSLVEGMVIDYAPCDLYRIRADKDSQLVNRYLAKYGPPPETSPGPFLLLSKLIGEIAARAESAAGFKIY